MRVRFNFVENTGVCMCVKERERDGVCVGGEVFIVLHRDCRFLGVYDRICVCVEKEFLFF